MNGDGDDLALSDWPAVQRIHLLTGVEGWQHADVGEQQGQLLTHVDHPARGPDTEAEEQEQGHSQEDDDDSAGALAQTPRDGLDGGGHGGDGPRCWSGGRRNYAAAVVRLHHGPHLTDALNHSVLGGAAVGEALGKLGALVGQTGVRTVGVVPQLGILGVVTPGVTGSDNKKIITLLYFY